MATSKKTEEVISIRPVEKRIVNIRIVGDSPLIVHNWTKKAKQQMLDAQTKKTKTKAKEAKDPFYDFADSLHWICGRPDELNPDTFEEAIKNGAKWGFPADAIKKAGNSAAYRMGWVKNQMALRASYGKSWLGNVRQFWQGRVGHGKAGHGTARQSWQVETRYVALRRGTVWQLRCATVGCGEARYGRHINPRKF